ncbi:hypothetical protein EKD04_013170 [Chloroflexales bacterium ZM16-3]|nr:hypothetical protein [Chloroflexales bacterium ZM16-3]
MINLELTPITPRRRGARALPAAGQRLRVAMRSQIELWQGNQRVMYYAGDAYEGTVAAVDDDGLLDLLTDDGEQMRIYAHDPAFELESL